MFDGLDLRSFVERATWVGSAQIYVVAVQCRTTGRPDWVAELDTVLRTVRFR